MNPTQMTVNIIADFDWKTGRPLYEEVLVNQIADNHFQLIHSPGTAPGLAAGDEFALDNNEQNGVRIIRRAGNLCVQIYFRRDPVSSDEHEKRLNLLLKGVGGWLDGKNDDSTINVLVYTIPVVVGFSVIESLLNQYSSTHPDVSWSYGNVYDTRDDITPLNWWTDFLPKSQDNQSDHDKNSLRKRTKTRKKKER